MPFDPEEWLRVADICCDPPAGHDQQAYFRTAVNRAYYAALLTLKQRIEQVQGRGAVPSTKTHEAIFQAIRTGGEAFEDIYDTLRKLKEARNSADYVLDAPPLIRASAVAEVNRSKRLIRNKIRRVPAASFKRLRVSHS